MYRFRTRAGRTFVQRGDYSLTNGEGDIVSHSSWCSFIQPGAALLMAAIVRVGETSAVQHSPAVCPRCSTVNDLNQAMKGILRWYV